MMRSINDKNNLFFSGGIEVWRDFKNDDEIREMQRESRGQVSQSCHRSKKPFRSKVKRPTGRARGRRLSLRFINWSFDLKLDNSVRATSFIDCDFTPLFLWGVMTSFPRRRRTPAQAPSRSPARRCMKSTRGVLGDELDYSLADPV